MNFDIITNPWFYVVAVPSVMLMGTSKAGFGGGFGALAVPMMALTMPVSQAAAIMMPLLLVADVMSLKTFWPHFDRALLKFLLPCGLLGVVIGTLSFRFLSPNTVAGIVGFFTLAFLAQRFVLDWLNRHKTGHAQRVYPKWLGAVLTATAGFTSFIAHAGGPPLNAYLLPMRLKPIVFASTVSYLFVFINASKWLPYWWLDLLDLRNFWTSMVLVPFVMLGVFLGLWMAKHLNPTWFYRLVYAGMFLSGVKLLMDGFK